ncbi:hypothetical protein WFP10_10430 [Yersinia enterocolitica]
MADLLWDKEIKMSDAGILAKLQGDIEILQNRIGGAEYVIKLLVQKMHQNEIEEMEKIIQESIKNFGEESEVASVMNESLRLIQS